MKQTCRFCSRRSDTFESGLDRDLKRRSRNRIWRSFWTAAVLCHFRMAKVLGTARDLRRTVAIRSQSGRGLPQTKSLALFHGSFSTLGFWEWAGNLVLDLVYAFG